MANWHSKSRLFDPVRFFDLGVSLVIMLVVVGIFFLSGLSGARAQIDTSTQPIEVDLLVQSSNVRYPQSLFAQGLKSGGKTNLMIKNQPSGEIGIKSVKNLPITTLVPQPDGSVKELPDPKAERFNRDMLITLQGKAQISDNGPLLSKSKLKIGTPVEMEGFNYDLKATVIDLRIVK